MLLPGYFRLELHGFSEVGSHSGNPLAPDPEINAGCLAKGRRQRVVVVASGESQLEQRVAGAGFDLRRQHTTRRAPRLPHVAARLDDQYPASAHCQLSGTGGSDGAAANHYYVMTGWHWDL
jgi:hypothetical protein